MSDTLEVMNKVNAFYQAAWTNLLWFTGILFATLGVFIPLVIQYLQSRTFSRDKKAHMEYLSSEVIKAKEELKAHFETQMKDRDAKTAENIEQMKNNLTTQIASETGYASAGIFFLQAKMSLDGGETAEAARDYAIAARKWLQANLYDRTNSRRAISTMIQALSKSFKDQFEAETNVEPAINSLLKTLQEPDHLSFFSDDVNSIKKELKEALKRPSPKGLASTSRE